MGGAIPLLPLRLQGVNRKKFTLLSQTERTGNHNYSSEKLFFHILKAIVVASGTV